MISISRQCLHGTAGDGNDHEDMFTKGPHYRPLLSQATIHPARIFLEDIYYYSFGFSVTWVMRQRNSYF